MLLNKPNTDDIGQPKGPCSSKFNVLQSQVEEFKSIPAKSEKIITETTIRNSALEKEKEKEEEKLKEVMDSLKQETQGLQKEKEVRFFISWCLFR